MTRLTSPARQSSDDGVAMVLVLIWSAILLLMATVVGQAAVHQIRPSDRNEASYQAWAAAEAGVDDYRARIAGNAQYYSVASDPSNPALTGWVDIPGGASRAQYTYSVDASVAARSGELRVTSTGRAGGLTRTVEAVLAKRSAYDYSYLSAFETVAPDYPGAYTGKQGELTAAEAEQLCGNRYWYQAGLVALPSTTGLHRNSRACKYTPIDSNQRWYGRIHSNDAWYLSPSIPNIDPESTPAAATQVFNGAITSSCPLPSATTAGCPDGHRWIDPTYVGTSGSYLPIEILDNAPKLWNPTYESELAIPSASTSIKTYATTAGCLFTGPTRIRFFTGGKIVVTSPDTKSVNSFCLGGSSLTGTTHATVPTTAQPHPTVVLDYTTMVSQGFNGVIYVQDVPASVADVNHWSTAPSCEIKYGTNPYPFVIPNPGTDLYSDADLYSGSMTNAGFPLEGTNSSGPQIDAWSTPVSTKCAKGSIYVQGHYSGNSTIVAEGDIAITGDLMDETVSNRTDTALSDYGVPAATSTNILGLVPTKYLYVFHPTPNTGGSKWIEGNMRDLILNFATVSLTGCFSVQDFNAQPQMGNLTFVGSLGQKYRCRVASEGGSTGYTSFTVRYDTRFDLIKPPAFMLELSQEPWRVESMSETGVRQDVEARTGVTAISATQARSTTVSYNVLGSAPAGSTLNFTRVLTGYGTATTTVSNTVSFQAPAGVGTTIVEFVVTKPDGLKVGQTLTIQTT